MKRKIVISLLALLLFYAIGAGVSMLYITDNTEEMSYIIKLHQVEQLRRSLVINVQSVQSDLYKVNTPFANNMDSVVENMVSLENAAQQCTSCHHPPRLTDRIIRIQSLIKDYQNALSSYLTASANTGRIENLKVNAVDIGSSILTLVEEMSHKASDNLESVTDSTMERLRDVRKILIVTLMMAFFFIVLIAAYLKRSITRPMSELVTATRNISSGNFGVKISYNDNTEFGELARHFNAMSDAVKDGYEEIQKEMAVRIQTQEALIKSEKFLNTMFDSIRDPFCIIDRDYKIVRVNEAYADMRKISIEDIVGERCYEVLQERKAVCKDCIVEKTFKSKDPCAKNKPLVLQNRTRAWLEIYTYPIFGEGGEVSHVVEYIRDITDRKLAEDALRESEERYVLAARGANDGLWDWNLKSKVVYYSPRWKAMLGFEEHEIKGTPEEWLSRIHPEDRMQVETEMAAHINGLTPNFKNEHRMLHKDGTYRWMLSRGLAVCDSSGKAYRMSGSMTDVTERKTAEEQLMFDALHDSLTGLPNRALFMDRLRHVINREKRNSEYLFAVLFLDIDRFKVLNDSLGHTKGDELLIAISQRIEDSLRPGDTVARFGGDEFAVLLEDLKDGKEAVYVAERIQEQITSPFNLNGQEVFTSASIGITFSTIGYEQPEHFLRDADIAMYYAKSSGSARYEIFDKRMYANALARMQLETDLRQAIKQNEFLLHYQPIVSLQTGRIISLESLVRWQHPARGLIYPGEFINTAEETGLIIHIGEAVLQHACRQLRIWQEKFPSNPPLSVSVNISSKQLFPNLIKQIKQVLQENRLAQNSLILEITESMFMENAASVSPLLSKLKEMNVQLHIDDFGTGYSSLSYLHHFPIDVLKIDRSFVMRLGYNGENLEIVKAITTLAHSLNMEVIAEGVEKEEQLAQLKSLSCEYVQGYLISKPVDVQAVEELLKQGAFDLNKYLTPSRLDA
ncbi:MAG: EAL domain-containing protein [Nitrospirae bacterium]|nr:EAL domain-containing protein [Nitrospirota bacterium]